MTDIEIQSKSKNRKKKNKSINNQKEPVKSRVIRIKDKMGKSTEEATVK